MMWICSSLSADGFRQITKKTAVSRNRRQRFFCRRKAVRRDSFLLIRIILWPILRPACAHLLHWSSGIFRFHRGSFRRPWSCIHQIPGRNRRSMLWCRGRDIGEACYCYTVAIAAVTAIASITAAIADTRKNRYFFIVLVDLMLFLPANVRKKTGKCTSVLVFSS